MTPMLKRLSEILILTDMLTERIDEPSLKHEKITKEFLDALEVVKELGHPILDKFYENKQVRKSTIFTEIAKKINYNFNKYLKYK